MPEIKIASINLNVKLYNVYLFFMISGVSVYSYQADPSNGAQADPLNGAKLTP